MIGSHDHTSVVACLISLVSIQALSEDLLEYLCSSNILYHSSLLVKGF